MSLELAVVVPSIRPDRRQEFVDAWRELFRLHRATLITVWDGDSPEIEINDAVWASPTATRRSPADVVPTVGGWGDLFFRRTDAVRNLGFVVAAARSAGYVLTLDDDVTPPPGIDPIQQHLDTLKRRVPLGWMNTAHAESPYLRGVPYGCRSEAPVMLSHGVWDRVPDFDAETQLALSDDGRRPELVPTTLPYYVGPVPRGVLFPLCGMSVMVPAEALPYLYYAPQGPDTGVDGLHRFADIFMGARLKRIFDRKGWACYTGGSRVVHTRASDARRNLEQERLGRRWLEDTRVDRFWTYGPLAFYPTEDDETDGDRVMRAYFDGYHDQATRYADVIRRAFSGGR